MGATTSLPGAGKAHFQPATGQPSTRATAPATAAFGQHHTRLGQGGQAVGGQRGFVVQRQMGVQRGGYRGGVHAPIVAPGCRATSTCRRPQADHSASPTSTSVKPATGHQPPWPQNHPPTEPMTLEPR